VDKETRNLLLIAGGVVAAYYIVTNFIGSAVTTVSNAAVAAGNTIGAAVYELFNGDAGTSNSVYHVVTFPDGSKHAVSSDWVAPDSGVFVWPPPTGDGNSYDLSFNQSTGTYYATGPL
jgi:hypothetical protein